MRQQLTAALIPLLAGLTITVTACSSAAPLSGAGTAGGSAAASGGTAAATFDGSASGMSAACTGAVDDQAAIAGLFARPVDGHRLTKAEVATVFGRVGKHLPSSLDGSIATLHDAAERAVARSAVVVASILAEQKVSDAMGELSAFVNSCDPGTG